MLPNSYKPLPEESFNHFIKRIADARVDKETINKVGIIAELAVTELHEQPYEVSADLSDEELVIRIVHKGKALRKDIIMLLNDFMDIISYHALSSDKHKLIMKKKRENV